MRTRKTPPKPTRPGVAERARRFLAGLPPKTKVVVGVAGSGLVLYLLGVQFLLFPALVFLAYRYLPLPGFFGSAFSRLFVSVFVTFSLLPIAGAIQFLVLTLLPQTDFAYTAALVVLLQTGLLLLVPLPKEPAGKRPWFTSADGWGLTAGALFVLPFALLISRAGFSGILQIAGFQVVDAGHHFSFLIHYGQTQFLHLGYYPAGFHFALAFIQESAVGQLFDAGWRFNALLYLAHYLGLGVALGYAAYQLCLRLFVALKVTSSALRPHTLHALLGLCLAPPLLLFYLLPLFAHGFLNYLYVITVVLLGFVFLLDAQRATGDRTRSLYIFLYMLLAYSAVSSWSLFIPLVVVIGVFALLPARPTIGRLWNELVAVRNLPILGLLALQLVLVYFQATTIQLGSREGFNATGNLTQLHYLVLLMGLGLTLFLAFSQKIAEEGKRVAYHLLLPSFLFVLCMGLVQYFQVGEVRYFTVKIGLFVEILSLILAVALLVRAYVQAGKVDVRFAIWLPTIPLIGMTLLLSTLGSPLREIREITKPYSGIDKPQYYAHDAGKFAELGVQNKMMHFNAISLHYIREIPKLDGYMQLSYRANLFRQGQASNAISDVYGKKSAKKVLQLRECNDKVYSLVEYGQATPAEQEKLVQTLRLCAQLAARQGLNYYIVTDAISAPHIQEVFGDVAKVVY